MDSQRHAQAFYHQQGQHYQTPVLQQAIHPRVKQLRGRAARAASPQHQHAEPASLNSEAHPPMGNDPPASDFDEQAFGQRLLAELGRAPSTFQDGQTAPGNPMAAENQREGGREFASTPNFTDSSPAQEYTAIGEQNSAEAFTPARGPVLNNIDTASFFSDEAKALLQDPYLPTPSSWVLDQQAYGMDFFNGHAGFPGSMASPDLNGTQYLPFVPMQPSYQPSQAYQPVEYAAGFEDNTWYGDFSQGFPAAPTYNQSPPLPVPTSTASIQNHETIDLTQDTDDDVVPTTPIKKRKRSNDSVGKEASSFKKQALAFQPPSYPSRPSPPSPPKPTPRRQPKGHRHIQGFPPASSPLPPNLEFSTILQDYPNHVHGDLILRMNREGDYTVRMMRETSKCLVKPDSKNEENSKGVYVLEEKELKNRLASARPRFDPEGKGSKNKRRRTSDEEDAVVEESSVKKVKVDDKGTADASSRRSSTGNAQYPTPPKTVPSSPVVATFPTTHTKPSVPAPAPAPTPAAAAATAVATTIASNTSLNLQMRMHNFLFHHFYDHMQEINLNKTYKKKTNTYTNAIHKYAEDMIARQEKIAKGEFVKDDEPVKPKVTGIIKGVKASTGETDSIANHRQKDASKAASGNGSGVSPVVVKVDRKKPPRSAGVGYSGVKKAWREKQALVKKNKNLAEGKGKGKGIASDVGFRQVEQEQQQQQEQLANNGNPSVAENEHGEEEDGEFDIDDGYHQDLATEKDAHDDRAPLASDSPHNNAANTAKGQRTDDESHEASDDDDDDDDGLEAEIARCMARADGATAVKEMSKQNTVQKTAAVADEEEEEDDDGLEAELARHMGTADDENGVVEEEEQKEKDEEEDGEEGVTTTDQPYYAVDEESEESEEE